jgi:hypothetical protein
MLEITGAGRERGSSRRSFLRAGALTIGGLSLPSVLRARAALPPDERRDTAVILLWMTGGPSHIDTWDMKPHAPAEVRGPFRPIATRLPGLDVCELMTRHAAIADRLALVRSFGHLYGVHDDAQHLVQTGWPQPNARQAGQRHPCQGSVTSLLRGPVHAGMPAYVCVPEDYRSHAGFYQAAAFLSPRHNALNSGGDPALGNYRPAEFALPGEVPAARLARRKDLFRALDDWRRTADSRSESLDEFQHQALELLLGSRAREAFDLSREPESLVARYGSHAWGRYALLARRLVEAGVTFVTVNLYEKDVDWWDDHYTIEKNLRRRLPVYDQAFSTLIEDLHERGLSDRVLVVACGEFGRAPRIDQHAGRGHWPRVMQAVLSGGGIVPGQVVGATTDDGGDPCERVLVPGDLLASIYRVLGIDHQATVADRQGRPVNLLEIGVPIPELFGSPA